MKVILFIIGLILAGDGLAVIVSVSFEVGAFLTFIIGLILMFWSVNYKRIKASKGAVRFCQVLFKIGVIYIFIASVFLGIYGSVNDTDYTEDYLIVLGCGIKDSRPTMVLEERLDAAIEYVKQNPEVTIIVTGGQGPNENMPEAQVMYNYLVENGIDSDNIIKESESHNTYENYQFSDKMLNNSLKEHNIVTVTSDYHMFRAKLYAKLAGIDTNTYSTRTSIYFVPVSYVRESLAIIKMLLYYIPEHFV